MFRITADLYAGDTGRISAHLLRLSPEDRSMRFSAGLVRDETIHRYVGPMRFGHDPVPGLVSQCGLLFGLAHGCVFEFSRAPASLCIAKTTRCTRMNGCLHAAPQTALPPCGWTADCRAACAPPQSQL